MSELLLSVSGARGIVGESMTPAAARDFAKSFGSHLIELGGKTHPTLLIGRDTRPSSPALAKAAAEGLQDLGCEVVQLGVVATPTVAVMVNHRNAAGGLVITASHNPIEYNGLKCLNAGGIAPPPGDVEQVVRRFRSRSFGPPATTARPVMTSDETGNRTHVTRVLANIDTETIRTARLTVVLDSANGAGGQAAQMLLEALGCHVIHLNAEPTGRCPHGLEPIGSNLAQLAQETAAHRAAVGFGLDLDADRMALVDETGTFAGEEYTILLAAKRLLDLNGGATVVVNLSTSRMIDDVAAEYPDATVVRTAVGEANVAAAMVEAGALVGGEGNGGVIFPPVCWVRDSLSAMGLTLSLLAADGAPLSAVLKGLPRYTMRKHRFELERLGGLDAAGHILERVKEHYRDEDVNTADGVRIDFADGWAHLRASNTEPIVRLIVEAKTASRAHALAEEVTAVMKRS